MDEIGDKFGKDMADNNLSEEETETLYHLLNKIKPEWMEEGLEWFTDTDEESIKEEMKSNKNFYRFAIQNFFALCVNFFIRTNFGGPMRGLMSEVPHEDFKELPFIKMVKECTDGDEVNNIAKVMELVKGIIKILP